MNTGDEIYTDEAIATALLRLPAWRYSDGCLVRDYDTHNWKGAMMLANLVAHYAEVAWHHPELLVTWGRVSVHLRTHSANGITRKDFELAEIIEQAVAWRPSEDGALEGVPDDTRWVYLK